MTTKPALHKLSAIVNATFYLQQVNKDLGYVPDYALAGLSVTVEEARKIRDIIQERKLPRTNS